MPELPEVEWGRRLALATALGRRIERVKVAADPIVFAGLSPRRLARALEGATVIGAHRLGKYLWLELDRTPHVVLHLGMTGGLHTPTRRFLPLASGIKEPLTRWPPRFSKLQMIFGETLNRKIRGGDEGEEGDEGDEGDERDIGARHQLVLADARRLARVRLVDAPLEVPPLSRLGPDLLNERLSFAAFAERLFRRRGMVKGVLLDQAFLAGAGNWIADEVLYQSRLDPRRPVQTLSREETKRLYAKLYRVVSFAVSVQADKTRFPKSWLFHRRWGRVDGAVTSNGQAIEHIVVAGRSTAFVPSVQR
ncbi:MAG: hypothetical protein IPK13_23605 [Deltaproteobacteria bacterium]|nr:hypothetical protein [Deltaproteobacteria bacterium]